MSAPTATTIDHLKVIVALPFLVLIIIPSYIYYCNKGTSLYPMNSLSRSWAIGIGIFLLAVGLPLFVQAIRLFVKIGKGTLAPWNPTRKLVVRSLYRHTRNPMILGVLTLLTAEAFLFSSTPILIWAGTFLVINQIYFIFKEEPDLEKRFGEEYVLYKANVPRWWPRLQAWKPEDI